MTDFKVTLTIDKDIAQLTQKAVKRTVDLTVTELRGNLQKNSPVNHGKMQSGWLIAGNSVGELNQKIYSSAVYTKYVNDGTGIYGPRGRLIRPKTKKALAFQYKGKKVVVPYVKGIKPRKFVEKSIQQTKKRIPEFTIRAVMETEGAGS